MEYTFWYKDKNITYDKPLNAFTVPVDNTIRCGTEYLRAQKDFECAVEIKAMSWLPNVGEGFPIGSGKKPSPYLRELMEMTGMSFNTVVKTLLVQLSGRFKKAHDHTDQGRSYCVRCI